MPKTPDHKVMPYTENYPPLRDWLDKNNARCAWQIMRGPKNGPTQAIEMWLVGGRTCIVIVQANGHGWELYTADPTGKIVETFVDAEGRLGISPPRPRMTCPPAEADVEDLAQHLAKGTDAWSGLTAGEDARGLSRCAIAWFQEREARAYHPALSAADLSVPTFRLGLPGDRYLEVTACDTTESLNVKIGGGSAAVTVFDGSNLTITVRPKGDDTTFNL